MQLVRTGELSETQTYAYDASDRIVSVCFRAGICPGASDPFIRWTYDKVGNRLGEQRPSGTTSSSYDAADQMLRAGSASHTYDQNGNELSAGSRTFTYDLANRMKTTRLGSTTTTYSYDGDGVRVKASTGSKSSQTTSYLWDVNNALPQIALEQTGSGSVIRSYAYGARRISMTSGSATSYYHYDPIGSVASVTSSSGSRRWTYAYEPFGTLTTEQRSGGNAPTNSMKFTGEHLDPTGLYHLRARQYDPVSGRFLRPDPARAGGAPVDSAYVYAGNRPTVLIDPSGETFQHVQEGADIARFSSSFVDSNAPLYFCFADPCHPGPSPPPVTCAALPGYPLGVIGGFNGGPAAHRAKPPYNWQSDNAIDLNIPVGTKVCAVFKGKISPTLGFGRSTEGYRLHLVGATDTAFYQHLSRIAVRSNQSIEKGQLLGFSGCGSERVPHLHLALLRGNPLRYAPPYRRPVNYGC
ncbi:MAG: peptidoglycan DD-metalloendopeptidase family protein [Actinobacteria bacterium]|nr:peptidoglycan DD-metalloendopeptidase family protein [Actinomycetota bacterium]